MNDARNFEMVVIVVIIIQVMLRIIKVMVVIEEVFEICAMVEFRIGIPPPLSFKQLSMVECGKDIVNVGRISGRNSVQLNW